MVEEPIIRPNCNGTPSVRGTRLTIYSVMDFHLARESPEAIADAFGISIEDAQAAMSYIDLHERELMPRYLELMERNRRGNPPRIESLLSQSSEKLLRAKAEFDRTRTVTAKAGAENGRIAG